MNDREALEKKVANLAGKIRQKQRKFIEESSIAGIEKYNTAIENIGKRFEKIGLLKYNESLGTNSISGGQKLYKDLKTAELNDIYASLQTLNQHKDLKTPKTYAKFEARIEDSFINNLVKSLDLGDNLGTNEKEMAIKYLNALQNAGVVGHFSDQLRNFVADIITAPDPDEKFEEIRRKYTNRVTEQEIANKNIKNEGEINKEADKVRGARKGDRIRGIMRG